MGIWEQVSQHVVDIAKEYHILCSEQGAQKELDKGGQQIK